MFGRYYFEVFDLHILSFMVFFWGILNALNGVIVFNHDIVGVLTGVNYYYITGSIRFVIGLTTLTIAWYLWHFTEDIVILRRTSKKEAKREVKKGIAERFKVFLDCGNGQDK